MSRQPTPPDEGSMTITVNGATLQARAGQSVAGALLAGGYRTFRRTTPTGGPRSLFCGMGVCYDCLVTIDGNAGRRACLTPVHDGMAVEIGGTTP